MWILYTSTCFFLNTVKYHIKVLVSFSYQYTFSQMNNSEINHIPISCFFNLSSELSFQNLTSQIRKYDHKPDSDLIKIKSNSPKRYLFVSKTSRNCSYYIKLRRKRWFPGISSLQQLYYKTKWISLLN